MKTIPEMFATVAKQNVDRTAVVDGEAVVSYAELAGKVASLSAVLQEMGVGCGDRVALMLPNSLEFVIGYFAAETLGGIVVPMSDHYQQNELLYFLQECGVSLLITYRRISE